MAPRKKNTSKRKETPVRPHPTSPVPQRQKQTYMCSCTQRCKGRLKQLTRVTYLKHAQFRELDAQKGAHASNLEALTEGAGSSGDDDMGILTQDFPQPSGTENPSHDAQPNPVSSPRLPVDPRVLPVVDENHERYECETSDLDNIFEVASLSDFRITIEFINALRSATLDGEYSNLSLSAILIYV
ncbi:hypothetical protein HYPSUDRAFT_196511 [Hypholoma sublateritium FD-334 SS-4]|uniref:Uncharacterized protein n=1 Tax=Hypholoma sublateritium (strain FD-334 SS-4) TaxID=945553 RepID=A0A0D2PQ71_HYPSF|nr:hypothetical protein HYPSUDRAFT_203582 [Hypholoma sublateritium FD-334 SS-4]KJA30276.1 hypothetical protein HYPSUDRAFT_196511 [Hypholoma sublateritium FD-334 SS-4]